MNYSIIKFTIKNIGNKFLKQILGRLCTVFCIIELIVTFIPNVINNTRESLIISIFFTIISYCIFLSDKQKARKYAEILHPCAYIFAT